MPTEDHVIAHYRHGALEEALLAGLAAAGKDLDRLTPEDLAAADEFHVGGRAATRDFAAALAPEPGTHLLDIGSGIGGPSRFFAEHYRCRIDGVDLSAEYVATASALARRVGLADRVAYRHASALDLPFPDATFDAAYMQHVGMNIADKSRLFKEVHRVIKPGGLFAIYDVMRIGDGPFSYPVPWSSGEESNFIATPAEYRALLTADGFEIVQERNRLDFALAFFEEMQAKMAASGGPPPFGQHILMGANAREKVGNIRNLVRSGIIAPVEFIARRVEPNPHAGNV